MNKLDNTKLDTVLLSSEKDRKIKSILYLMKDVEETLLDLRRDDVILSDERDKLSVVIKVFPSMQDRLKRKAQIVHSPLFRDGIVQIESGKQRRISFEQCKLVKKLQNPSSSDLTESSAPLSLLERAGKSRKTRYEPFSINMLTLDLLYLRPISVYLCSL